jgi:hypothetical protein
MADMTTHVIFSNDVLSTFEKKDYVYTYYNYYKLGSQGPDPYLYISSKDENPRIGDLMHEKDTGLFFINFLNYIKRNPSKQLQAFFYGMVNHFSLDSNIHPYIYYTTGIYKPNKPETLKYRGMHLKIERLLDRLYLEQRLNVNRRRFNSYKYCLKGLLPSTEIKKALDVVIEETYQVKGYGEKYEACVKRMKSVTQHVAFDRTGIKKQVLKLYDKYLNKTHPLMYQTISFNSEVNDNIDYFNEGKNTWLHPLTGEEQTSTVFELIENGLNTAVLLIQKADLFLEDKIDEVELRKYFKDISYDTGIENSKHSQLHIFGWLFDK